MNPENKGVIVGAIWGLSYHIILLLNFYVFHSNVLYEIFVLGWNTDHIAWRTIVLPTKLSITITDVLIPGWKLVEDAGLHYIPVSILIGALIGYVVAIIHLRVKA